MSQVPAWIQITTAFATPSIALMVGFIAYRQWRTAQDKIVLDLFEKRLAVYTNVRKAVGIVNTHGHPDEHADRMLLEAIDASQFLFGPDIREYLDEMWKDFSKLRLTRQQLEGRETKDRRIIVENNSALFKKITTFYYEGPFVFSKYIGMHHKLSRRDKSLRRKRPE